MGEKRYRREYVSGVGYYFHDGNQPLSDDGVVDLLNSQSSEIAGLRKACEWVLDATIGKKLNNYDRIPIPASALIALHEALGNPSEIPNSSEFLVTEADQREADRAIADGSAKLQMPETGHGITEETR